MTHVTTVFNIQRLVTLLLFLHLTSRFIQTVKDSYIESYKKIEKTNTIFFLLFFLFGISVVIIYLLLRNNIFLYFVFNSNI